MRFLLRERRGAVVMGSVLLLSVLGGWLFSLQYHATAPAAVSSVPSEPATDNGGTLELPARGDLPTAPAPASKPNPPTSPSVAPPAPKPAAKTITVFVSGAVKRPDVYTLKPGDRIYKAINAAGGFKPNADQSALNMADEVRDADQINVPVRAPQAAKGTSLTASTIVPGVHPAAAVRVAAARKGADDNSPAEDAPPRGRVLGKSTDTNDASNPEFPANVPSAARTAGRAKGGTKGHAGHSLKFKNPGDGVVNLNTAGAEELQKLPGVGPAMSERILEYRKEIGKFNSIEQIRDVKGIGEKKYAKMEPFLKV